uniref:ribonuclease H family protein n=1 Tax=Oculatella sp. LEGE 06141 TaxID=1828648 RepID=UPI001D15DA1C|nr:ribonuclease H [Oculatella sp. LEGE 06141]
MLQIRRIDVKTGLTLYETIEAVNQTREKRVEHSYLEHWLNTHGLNAQFSTGKFYRGVNEADRLRLESEGKALVFTNGKDGYFTDPDTARLMTFGDPERNISPIYAGDRNSPHNFVAYGSLVASDGIASTSVQQARILVIDDERRSHGEARLLDRNGKPIPPEQLEKLYDKMGDGTMLVRQWVMRGLITLKEHETISKAAFANAGISRDLTTIAQDASQLDSALQETETQAYAVAARTVTQFRAATPDLPGLIKGTMASSRWCDRLGVDAIISSNDIKGDDGRLSAPGIKGVSNFWINRKSDGQYGKQAVGPQVKGCIPQATLHEFNPRIEAQAQELADVASDPIQLSQYYVQQKERQLERGELEEGETQEQRPDWLYEVLNADRYGQLASFSKTNKELSRYLKGAWLDNALRGIYVPSAMAQHHAQLKPWEVCNKDLPHGAIVAYYRSPFPNVGAAAIAINNTAIIKEQDQEAFSKHGVAYLPPWTAKAIAITDFDRDANGYFVGYRSTVSDLPQQIRQQMEAVQDLPPAEQYEAGRSLFHQMIQKMEQGTESRITPGEYPLAVKEFIESNAPDCKPPEIIKQKKIKHPWHEEEPHAAATWRAWEITADNPTGKVANVGMTLQSLALEMTYAPASQQEDLLRQVSAHYAKQLQRADEGNLFIPDNAWLQERGFPAYRFGERIEEIAQAGSQLARIQDPQSRQQFIEKKLQLASRMLLDVVNGPNAENLQTAVDTAKSSRGIDESIHAFAMSMSHKQHLMRQHYKAPTNYVNGNPLPTNTQEPIGWGVETVNRFYQETQLPELENKAFRDLFPKSCSADQERQMLAIARTYNQSIAEREAARDRLRENRPEDQEPTLQITSSNGRELVIQRLQDPDGTLPIWRASGIQPNWNVVVERDAKAKSEETQFPATLSLTTEAGDRHTQLLGYVSPESVAEHHLEQRLQQLPNNTLTIRSPKVRIRPPFAQQNDPDDLGAKTYVQDSVAQIPEAERSAYLSALWRQSDGMGFALKHFTDLICDRLQTVPEITLTGIQRDTNEAGQLPSGEYTARFSQYSYANKAGETKTVPSIAIVQADGSEQQFGALSPRSVHLPLGTLVTAQIAMDASGETARMQVLALAAEVSTRIDLPSEGSVVKTSEEYTPDARSSLTIATDGACSGNPGPGGWGAILSQGEIYQEIGGHVPDTTNNRMEMMAGIEALKYARANGLLDRATAVKILSDSQIFIKGATGEWKRKANKDLWAEYDQAATGANIQFEWVRGHNGHPLNERVDAIATAFAKGQNPRLTKKGGVEVVDAHSVAIAGKPVQMVFPLRMHGEHNPLPIDSCIEAMRGYGRCHTTRTFAPHAAYQFKEGDIAVAYAGSKQVAFRVGEQYPITPEMITSADYKRQWAATEKHSAKELDQLWHHAQSQAKSLWGMKMEPLGDYIDGQIHPFPDRSNDIYSPSRDELLTWLKAATEAGNEAVRKQAIVLGKRLRALYNEQIGESDATPPLDYRHSLVVVSERDRQQRQQEMEVAAGRASRIPQQIGMG